MTHYTMEQWQDYILGDETCRSAMDSHLYDCEVCMDRYLQAVEQLDNQLPPMNMEILSSFTPIIQSPVNTFKTRAIAEPSNRKHWYTNVIFHYTIAATITLVLVSSGVFQQVVDRISHISKDASYRETVNISEELTKKAGNWLDSIPLNHEKKEGIK